VNAEDGRAFRAFGHSAAASGAWSEAAVWFDRSLARTPLDCCALAAHGFALLELGDVEGARRRLDQAETSSARRCQNARRLRQRLS
jgi:Flp pilus assembly protein TadD